MKFESHHSSFNCPVPCDEKHKIEVFPKAFLFPHKVLNLKTRYSKKKIKDIGEFKVVINNVEIVADTYIHKEHKEQGSVL